MSVYVVQKIDYSYCHCGGDEEIQNEEILKIYFDANKAIQFVKEHYSNYEEVYFDITEDGTQQWGFDMVDPEDLSGQYSMIYVTEHHVE